MSINDPQGLGQYQGQLAQANLGLGNLWSPAAMNDACRELMATFRRAEVDSLALRQRGEAARLAKPRKVR